MLNSRSTMPRVVEPAELPTRIPGDQVGAPCFCACTGTPLTGGYLGGGTHTSIFAGQLADVTDPLACDVSAGLDFESCRGELCSQDMVASFTIDSWWDGSPGYPTFDDSAGALIACRTTRDDLDQVSGYVFSIFGTEHDRTNGQAGLLAITWDGGTIDIGGGPLSPVDMVDGGLMELSTIGTTIEATFDGVTLFSVTDSTITNGMTNGSGPGSQTQYASWRLLQHGTTTCTASDFTATPIC